LDGSLDVQRTDDPVFSRADREVDKARAPMRPGQLFAACQPVPAVVAQRINPVGIAREGAVGYHFDLGQEIGQGARRRRFGRPALATDQHAADAAADRVQDQGSLHSFLTHNSRERKRSQNGHSLLRQCDCMRTDIITHAL